MATVTLASIILLAVWTVSFTQTIADDVTYNDLSARMLALEKREQKQSEVVRQMESELSSQARKIKSQERVIAGYQQKVNRLELTVEELQETSQADRVDTDQIIPSVRQNRLVVNGEGPVAFQAVVKQHAVTDHIGINQKVIFPDVIMNLGGGYSNQHGIFTAPQPGVYIFSTSILSFNTGHVEIMVSIIKNGDVLANAYAHGDSGRHDQGSVTVTTQMKTGDQVWVGLYKPPDASTWGESFDNFMGCLVTPL